MLREQGIPLESFSEDPLFETDNTVQRYRINAEEYQLTGVTFTAEEYTFLSLAAGMWDPASLDSAASRAMRKLSLRTPGAELGRFDDGGVRAEAGDLRGEGRQARVGDAEAVPVLAVFDKG